MIDLALAEPELSPRELWDGPALAGGADLRLGRWQDVLGDLECDALITDPPYSARTHVGHRDGVFDTNKQKGFQRRDLSYASWTEDDVRAFVAHFAPRPRGWFVAFCSHDLAPVYSAALEAAGRYVFAPLPWVQIGGRIRLSGDGPSAWTCWIVVARPKTREMQRWGTLPGAYVGQGGGGCGESHTHERAELVGGEPLWLMKALVRDYSRPGDLVCDPCAGGGTTLLAAVTERRRAVGAEMDPAHFEIANKRLSRGYTPTFDFGGDVA